MERKNFLRSLAVTAISAPVLLEACKKDANPEAVAANAHPEAACIRTDPDMDGPYPLYGSRGSAINRVDIRDSKPGLPLNIDIKVQSVARGCAPVTNARVDIWQCDKDGYYSGYVNNGYLGVQNNTGRVFCRGLQYTNAAGSVHFLSIYPGWYPGRCTHLHAQIFIGTTLYLTTQIAFPDNVNAAVYTTPLYAAHGQNPTTNYLDGIIYDSLATELATVTPAAGGGYNLSHVINI
ncbi:intradiol ring-cleavage dioxygenase [Chitinophaga qingshengii]|uniref:Intradiol ring-cleavage dioxygenase n=1 Tax=Chitinophaga qingshengii TaxID=1569794 RepID=A0ABR7TF22_9BACT|nr:intradiol ring-cleavage dioxygenase [Chitinophaga qingshengii]MBC9928911.1 intradiol ring-cleavage dioxygenase [Chitinophaga qingshengii]